jgi:hypothetical protein
MIENMRRLHPRGAANRGICVDAQGAMLGPDCVLVRSTPAGFRAIQYDAALVVQKCVCAANADRDWLFRQCQRIADALDKGEVALAQIYGLRIPVGELDDHQLKRIGNGDLAKVGFDPDEPRLPKGDPHGGEWTTGDNTSPVSADVSALRQFSPDTAGETGAVGSAPSTGSQSSVPGTGGASQSAALSIEPPISYRIIPPRTPTTPPPQTEEADNPSAPTTLDSPDLQSDPTDGPTTLDSPDLQLPDVSVTADSPENPIFTIPGIDAVNPDYSFERFLLLLATGGLGSWSSRALTRALIRLGIARRAGVDTHHIVAGRAEKADPARKVLERFGIGLDDATNGAFLPEAQHDHLHTNVYYDAVNGELAAARSRSEAEQILRSIARRLAEGRFP